MNRDALFCDGTEAYVSPAEPETGDLVRLWFRTEKDDVEKAILCFGEQRILMKKTITRGRFDFYETSVTVTDKAVRYYFEAHSQGERCIYNKCGVQTERNSEYDFRLVPGFQTPDWAKGVIWYSVMPDAYYNGDITNDEPVSGENYSNPWDISQHSLQHKYGGDLRGIEKKR